MNLIRKALLGTLTIAELAGCVTSSEPYSIPMTNMDKKEFVFKKIKTDGYGGISESDAIASVVKYVKKQFSI
ncbi:hypothetical protein KO505_08850 [Psychrosphaera sp. F3M07]|uniref:hypothetical protein n=1 Tax=Psychrosphaera sp. F3M07 TaxID=2841560 RepID=UPI001C0A2B3B|nr:hypothetical protein [Psychrosphaera sp. F3M07]MBU2918068.1 hypothetical protein [Psychrosphaera sp. F3M07]